MTPMGYTSVRAVSSSEKVFTVCIQISGAVISNSILATITASLTTRDRIEAQHVERLKLVDTFARSYGIDVELQKKIAHYTMSMYQLNRGIDPDKVIAHLPDALQEEIYMAVFVPFVARVPILANSSVDFLQVFVRKLKPQVCLRGDFVFRKGSLPAAMYFVQKGSFALLDEQHEGARMPLSTALAADDARVLTRSASKSVLPNPRSSCAALPARQGPKPRAKADGSEPSATSSTTSATVLSILRPGASFGEVALLTRRHHLYSAKALSDGVVFTCSAKDYAEVAEQFPEFVSRVRNRAKRELLAHSRLRTSEGGAEPMKSDLLTVDASATARHDSGGAPSAEPLTLSRQGSLPDPEGQRSRGSRTPPMPTHPRGPLPTSTGPDDASHADSEAEDAESVTTGTAFDPTALFLGERTVEKNHDLLLRLESQVKAHSFHVSHLLTEFQQTQAALAKAVSRMNSDQGQRLQWLEVRLQRLASEQRGEGSPIGRMASDSPPMRVTRKPSSPPEAS